MWETTNRDRSWHHLNCGNLELCIATRAKKDIENGRVCKWNIYMMFNDCHYSYVQINKEFTGTLQEAQQYAENYLRNLKESIPL